MAELCILKEHATSEVTHFSSSSIISTTVIRLRSKQVFSHFLKRAKTLKILFQGRNVFNKIASSSKQGDDWQVQHTQSTQYTLSTDINAHFAPSLAPPPRKAEIRHVT